MAGPQAAEMDLDYDEDLLELEGVAEEQIHGGGSAEPSLMFMGC